jgi:hypothetical protein
MDGCDEWRLFARFALQDRAEPLGKYRNESGFKQTWHILSAFIQFVIETNGRGRSDQRMLGADAGRG